MRWVCCVPAKRTKVADPRVIFLSCTHVRVLLCKETKNDTCQRHFRPVFVVVRFPAPVLSSQKTVRSPADHSVPGVSGRWTRNDDICVCSRWMSRRKSCRSYAFCPRTCIGSNRVFCRPPSRPTVADRGYCVCAPGPDSSYPCSCSPRSG